MERIHFPSKIMLFLFLCRKLLKEKIHPPLGYKLIHYIVIAGDTFWTTMSGPQFLA